MRNKATEALKSQLLFISHGRCGALSMGIFPEKPMLCLQWRLATDVHSKTSTSIVSEPAFASQKET